ncbi:neuronal acetylcholine receptor subunit alpha-3-like [Pecten maximus]|uniref:neuronal acetylcholine receptor subunit alpha-3-like n=1 Tax=Pecten maximus TaxID=6579 RepID=UPI0014585F28|nr:neuronal acetylcholine receptor subunit alpha-3-like [Pecten maximus]
MAAACLLFVLILCCGEPVLGRNGTMDDWTRLTNTLFSNYSKDVYPVYNLSEALSIDTTMFILSIMEFDEVSGVITLNGGLIHTWTDFRLTWDPSDYGGIEDILISSSLVWKPDVFLVSTAEDMRPFDSGNFDVRVYYNGVCQVGLGRRMVATCSVNMLKFPFDAHECVLLFMQWSVFPEERVLGFTRTDLMLDYYTANGEWTLAKSSVAMSATVPGGLCFTIHITRKPIYFTLSLIIPILLLCFLNPFVFLLPASSGERISYTITMFLSMAVYMSIIGDNLPKVSENMAGMSFFLLISLIYSGTLIILTIFTLRYEALAEVKDFPRIIRRITVCLKKRRKNTVINVRPSDPEEDSGKVDVSDDVDISKDDVMRSIDLSLFGTSLIVIVIFIGWFFFNLLS